MSQDFDSGKICWAGCVLLEWALDLCMDLITEATRKLETFQMILPETFILDSAAPYGVFA